MIKDIFSPIFFICEELIFGEIPFMSKNTADRVIAIVADYKEKPEDEITSETTLDELEMDSLDAMNLIFELEEEFDIEVPDDKVTEMKTIGEMVEGIEKLIELKEKGETVELADTGSNASEG